jgi:hypothetical protein
MVLSQLAGVPQTSGSRLRKRTALRPSRPLLAPTPSSAKKANCEPPYYFTDGIKNYKPGCI